LKPNIELVSDRAAADDHYVRLAAAEVYLAPGRPQWIFDLLAAWSPQTLGAPLAGGLRVDYAGRYVTDMNGATLIVTCVDT